MFNLLKANGHRTYTYGEPRYVDIFVDSVSYLQRPYGAREENASDILVVVKRFVANMGAPRVVRKDNGTEYSNVLFVYY